MAAVRGVLLDLDGTLYARGATVPGAVEAVAELRALGLGVRFLTNIDSKPADGVRDLLAGYGFDLELSDLFTPIRATRDHLARAGAAEVFPVVSEALAESFPAGSPPYTHVVVADCRDVLDYALLDGAFRALREGAELIALQRGRYFRRADGEHLDTGAIVAALEYAAGGTARVLGKPAAEYFELAANSLGLSAAECLVVGDDALTDIAGGRAAGARTVQVRTGKYAAQLAEGLAAGAGYTVDSIADVPALLGRLGTT